MSDVYPGGHTVCLYNLILVRHVMSSPRSHWNALTSIYKYCWSGELCGQVTGIFARLKTSTECTEQAVQQYIVELLLPRFKPVEPGSDGQ